MKIFRVKKFISVVLALCVLVIPAYASIIDSAVYNTNTDTVTVKGNMQDVSRIKAHGNFIKNGDGSSVESWAGNGTATLETVSDGSGSVIKVSGRTAYYGGIKQSVYDALNQYGFGKYHISGRIKADDLTASDGAVYTSENFLAGIKTNNYYIQTITIKGVGKEWVEFDGTVNIDLYGYESDKTTPLTEWPSTSVFFIQGAKTGDLRDFYIDDICVEYITDVAVYEGEESARLTVTDSSDNIVYVNEADTSADGSYTICFQLPDAFDTYGSLKVRVSGENTETVSELAITPANVNENIKTVYSGDKIKIRFNIFDFFNASEFSSISVIAASYMADGKLSDVSLYPLDINLQTSAEQVAEVLPPADSNGYVKLFLWNDLNSLVPVCELHEQDITLNPANLFLVGDSICAEYKDEKYYPQKGWGQYIGNYLSDKLEVVNCSHGGYSTSTFMQTDEYHGGYPNAHTWDSDTVIVSSGASYAATPILPMINEGDYVMVSLGINDNSSSSERNIYTDEAQYKANLGKMADDTAAKGATMIFVTPTISSNTATGTFKNTCAERGTWMKEVAAEKGITCIDLGARLTDIYNNEGMDTVKTYHLYNDVLKASEENGGFGLTDEQIAAHLNTAVSEGRDDKAHLSYVGADRVAGVIIELLQKTGCTLGKYVIVGE